MQRILVIDDEPFILEALKRVLGSSAVTVVGAANADAGLAAMRESPADLVIIDVILPGMDGVAAIKIFRRDYPAVRIIAISGGGNFGLNAYLPDAISTSAYLAACRAAGADGTLAKPFETAELRALIHQVQNT
ncbi:MAG: two-component system, OmpR family, response regulator CpxR [Gammaproteobacteria bacterium]|nr:two-component system, OmpR family, response regulator CpxR [Gammaproteobacteria bacterium]